MLAALLLNQPAAKSGGDDSWRKRSRKQRRAYINKLVEHDKLLQSQWQERARIDRELRAELTEAYRAMYSSPRLAEQVETIVAPYRDNRNPREPINWQWMLNRAVDVQRLLILYYDMLDEEALLLLM